VRLKLWSLDEARPVLLELARQADYFLPGLDELKLLYGTDDIERLAAKLAELPGVSIVKGGGTETYIVERGAVRSVPYVPVERVVDPVGAGDGFCAGFVVGLLKGYALEEAVRLANRVGAMVVQAPGDWEGLPTWDEVEAALNERAHIER
jgi:2-dehydro-3-deoxygluconokinase